MDHLLDLVKNDDATKSECKQIVEKLSRESLQNQALVAQRNAVEIYQAREAMQVAGNLLIKKDIRIEALEDQIGKVDEDRIKLYTGEQLKKIENGDSKRVNKLKQELQQELLEHRKMQIASKNAVAALTKK